MSRFSLHNQAGPLGWSQTPSSSLPSSEFPSKVAPVRNISPSGVHDSGHRYDPSVPLSFRNPLDSQKATHSETEAYHVHALSLQAVFKAPNSDQARENILTRESTKPSANSGTAGCGSFVVMMNKCLYVLYFVSR